MLSDGGVLTSIKFNLKRLYSRIIDGKKTKDSYINLLGILIILIVWRYQ